VRGGCCVIDPSPTGEAGRSGRHKTLLIVDDDETFAYAASRYLEKLGYSTVVASGSMDAFRKLEEMKVDLLIADVCLNDREPHGASLGRMLRNRNPDFPVLLVTAFPDLVEPEKPLPGPVFVKPVELSELAKAVEDSFKR
jgi:CheY-like chemotaxis protein